jgi:hypothetical protein
LRTSRDLQKLMAAVTHIEALPTLKVEKSLNFLSGYTETNTIHNRISVNYVLENVNKKLSAKILSLEIKHFKM